MASRGSVLHLSENLPLPFDRRVWMELNALRDAGFEVSAICPMGEPWTLPYEVIDGIAIWRYPPPPPASGFASYAWEFLYCWLQTLRLSIVVLARRGFDIVHAANPPDTFWAIAAALQAIRQALRVRSPRPLSRALRLAFRTREGRLAGAPRAPAGSNGRSSAPRTS